MATMIQQQVPRSAMLQQLSQSLMNRGATPAYGAAGAITNIGTPIAGALMARSAQTARQEEQDARTDALGRALKAVAEARASGQDPVAALASVPEAAPALPDIYRAQLTQMLAPEETKPETFGQPVAVMAEGSSGTPRYVQFGSQGSTRESELTPAPRTQNQPAAIVEFEYVQSLPDDERSAYMTLKRAGRTVDAGDRVIILDQSGEPVGAIEKGLPPAQEPDVKEAQAAATAVGRETGEKEATRPQRLTAARTAMSELNTKQDIVRENIARARDMANEFGTTGFLGGLSSSVPGTPAYDLARTIDTIRANVGFDQLQAMRDASPTGGALGQVSERENILLQSILGALDQAQTRDELLFNLNRLDEVLEGRQQERRAAFAETFGEDYEPRQSVPQLTPESFGTMTLPEITAIDPMQITNPAVLDAYMAALNRLTGGGDGG